MDKLTDDVLQTILDWVEDRATLHTLLFVSRRFYACTEPWLYSSVEFIAKPQTALRPRFDKFQRRIASNSYLASKVKKFTIDLADSKNPPEDFSLHDTLRYLVGLKDFKLKIWINSDISITALAKVHCPFLLTKFVWQNPRAGLHALVPFLESQPFIEHLHLVLTTTTINLSPEALPRLKELVVPSSMAMDILPGRKVTHLSLMLMSDNSSFDHTPSLAMEEALAHIEFLGCFASKTEYLLPGIRLMHKLRWLQIMFPAQSNADMLDLLRVVRDRATNLTYMQLSAFFLGSLKGLTTQILESVPPACLVDIGRQGNVVFDRYYAGKHISSVSEDVAPTEREWWWSEAKLRHVLTESKSLSPTSSPKHTRVTESSLKVHKRP
ncbi:hypothetical protein PLEOSDRAFT_1094123 [Pleurotus ostreatus PC15]|uniref:F-box domain-containing protein n=1 Tax=Pleurotus ostreatus (strain PC15) TaxID=1137138 RepID=A0A067NDB8_PLEO1|nr:hypothetical protein PLEOSDRAFT_1094123 [Pleurotus ostreatus PC15]